MNVPGGNESGAENDDEISGRVAPAGEAADDRPDPAAEAARLAARRRLAAQLQESLLPDITDDERPDYLERRRDDLGEWLKQNRPPHHDR